MQHEVLKELVKKSAYSIVWVLIFSLIIYLLILYNKKDFLKNNTISNNIKIIDKFNINGVDFYVLDIYKSKILISISYDKHVYKIHEFNVGADSVAQELHPHLNIINDLCERKLKNI